MTTSPPPPNSAPATAQETKLTDERAVTIGWFFIHSYYDFYNNKIENIHKIYNKLASISHSKFPSETSDESNEIYKAKGIDAIKLRFKNDDVLDNSNRIVITNAAFEVSLEKNLLIVVYGEWSKNSSPYYQFSQTFLLTPAPGANDERFDVANDILRFENVDNVIKSIESTEVKEEPKEVAVEKEKDVEPVEEEKEEPKEEPKEETKEEPKEEPKEAEPVEEPVEDKSEPVEVKQSTPEVPASEASSSTPTSASTPVTSATSTMSPPAKPAAPLSWAALASQAAAAAPKAAKSPSIPTPAVAKSQPAKKSPATPTTSKFKKEEWFPIYIRGVKSINEKRLRDVLSKSFGELKFFRTNLDIALVDFVTQEAQQEALNAKEIKIDGISISLEPRGSKTGNNFHSTGKKQKEQKPQQFQSSPSELKRTKSEKKPSSTPKKSNTPKKD